MNVRVKGARFTPLQCYPINTRQLIEYCELYFLLTLTSPATTSASPNRIHGFTISVPRRYPLALLKLITSCSFYSLRANVLVNEWAKCIAPDGYFYYNSKPNARHYTYDKMLWGLLE
ncbi:MAG: hypothetical protein JWQ71_2627 [Pedosphaera sp.]|nr:hypothetical protein [Pedosphaera sp.]